jgi:ribosome-binding factor A
MALGVHNNGWWGEGELKFFIDDSLDYVERIDELLKK